MSSIDCLYDRLRSGRSGDPRSSISIPDMRTMLGRLRDLRPCPLRARNERALPGNSDPTAISVFCVLPVSLVPRRAAGGSIFALGGDFAVSRADVIEKGRRCSPMA